MLKVMLFGFVAAAGMGCFSAAAEEVKPRDDALRCSYNLAQHENGKARLSGDEYRHCTIAVARSYLEFIQGLRQGDTVPLADDVADGELGSPLQRSAGAKTRILSSTKYKVIAAVRIENWAVDRNVAWVSYELLFKEPQNASMWIAERFVLDKGLIVEISAAHREAPTVPRRPE